MAGVVDERPAWMRARGRVVALAALAALSPFATDMYISALPAIAVDLVASTAAAQLTLTAFLVGFAVGQLVIGPLSDSTGRRRVLLVGMAGFVVTSVVCALSGDVVVLVVARALQGVLGAGASIAARAMVGDATTGLTRSRAFATIGALSAVAPVVAPLVGGAVLLVGDWRVVFWVLAAMGLVLLVLAWRWFPETRVLEASEGARGALRDSLGRMAELLRMHRFRTYLWIGCSATIGFFTYIASSSFVFQEEYGFSETAYTVVFASNATCMIASTLLFRRLLLRVPEERLYTAGLVACTAGSALVLVSALTGAGPALTWPALTLVTAGWGFVITGATTLTQALGHRSPGSAAALVGGLQFGLGGLATPLAGLLGGGVLAMGALMTAFLAAGLAVQLVARRRDARGLSRP